MTAPLRFHPRLTTTTTPARPAARPPRARTGFVITITASVTHDDGDPEPDWLALAAQIIDEFRRQWGRAARRG